ncbi:MAG: geranylgeranyl reductase family protein [Desulfarculaceae bacterium]|nr:geranylgeranyl reductase family protein [Desulfarculaceae bacterium]MCF8047615.1 geranylgeranyl reductase family protein [Desulfarculaceae bacterium]MCF8098389.1 geranylgeranyl reductase family protein [Desulfarculaceae bacterium]MCF8123922.1 geranylgeranyl reductase family protein [Desulfarculaceae bacterium]
MLNLGAMKRVFDVIIVGLGPAGASAAVELARSGAKVLALDGARGRDKPCGGCLSARGLEALAWLDPPAWLAAHPVRRLWIGYPGRPGASYLSPNPGAYLVERGRLDRWLAQQAAQAGAQVLSARARGVSREQGLWQVEGAGGPWRAKWLLAAGGAGGLTARRLGLGGGEWRFAALVQELPLPARLRPVLSEAAFLELGGVAGGYGWAFGRGETLNLGIAGLMDRSQGEPGSLRRCFEAFSRRLGLNPTGTPRGAVIPCPHRRRLKVAQDRVAVLGDAAGLADPVLGEGIAQAVVSGRMAAQAVLAGDLNLYQRAVNDTLLKDHHHARLLARLIYRIPQVFHGLARRRPGGIELGFNWLRGEIAPGDIWLCLLRGLTGQSPRLDSSRASYYSSPLVHRPNRRD